MKKVELSETRAFNPLGMKNFVLHESEFFKIINFNIAAGRIFPVHAHDLDGQVSIHIVEGTGAFLGDKEVAIPAKTGDILISDIREPHGVRADTDMRILVTIAPPI